VSVTVRALPLAHWWEPALVFQTIYGTSSHAFWLDAGCAATSGFSYLGAATERSRFVTASVASGTVTVTMPAEAVDLPPTPPLTVEHTIFEYLGAELAGFGPLHPSGGDAPDAPDEADAGGFRLGWVGWLGYELGAQTIGTPVHESRYPDAALLFVDRALVFDHAAREVTVLALLETGQDAHDLVELGLWMSELESRLEVARRDALRAEAVTGPAASATPATADTRGTSGTPGTSDTPATADPAPITVRWRHSDQEYADLIRRCQRSITAGDAYQICLTNEIELDLHPDPLEVYLALRAGSPSHHGGLLRFGEFALLSASPEQFLSVTSDGHVTTKPIKGTRPRGADHADDAVLQAELLASDKERAENLMIVDLMRNDLGRIAKLGSVAVSHLLAVESYAHVHQLVSTIEADLAPGVTSVDALVACFPAGSMTGAPKRSAMTILDELEAGPRGIYAGAFGYLGLDGAVDLAMVIRSIVLDSEGATIGTGGGITALSDPLEEIEETRVKAAALLAALGVRV
jgi:anthranilate/para-aminobenzoate synthase component I